MTVERHYDDEVLMSMVGNEAAQAAARRQHLADCLSCDETLQSYLSLADCLAEEALWDLRDLPDAPVPQTVANLRAFASEMDREGAQAEAILRELIAGPRESWMPRLQQHPEWRTAGVVRKLIAATDRAIDTMPPDAVAITALATDIADHLPPTLYASDTVLKLRGAAWRERAFSLYFTSHFCDAAEAVEKAETAFANVAVGDFETARLETVRGIVSRAIDDIGSATAAIRRAASKFEEYGQRDRIRSARSVEASIHFRQRDFVKAVAIWEELENDLGESRFATEMPYLLPNIAACYLELGDASRAVQYLRLAEGVYEDLGVRSELARVRWNLGVALLRGGRFVEAKRRLVEVRRDFHAMSMNSEAGLVAIDIADAVSQTDPSPDALRGICQEAVEDFRRSDLEYSDRAMAALAYLREAVQAGRASSKTISQVRQYIRRLPSEPQLLFAAPPE
jgi:tetratricopeptide (TPR) repeat protein